MSLLLDIQNDAIDQEVNVAPTLLKLRLLASKLGIKELAEWVKFESEGYPKEVEVPDYRQVGVSFYADFVGGFGQQAPNIAVPPHLIKTHAGPDWLNYSVRSGISELDDSSKFKTEEGGQFQISNAQDLVYALQGKMFEDFSIVQVRGVISSSGLAAIRHAVRAKILELTIKLEEDFPDAVAQLAKDSSKQVTGLNHVDASQMANRVVYGNYTEVHNSGAAAHITLTVSSGDSSELLKALIDAGIAKEDASAITGIIAAEKPSSETEPLGPKAQNWLIKNLGKAANGTWKIGTTVATRVLSEAALKYYGLK